MVKKEKFDYAKSVAELEKIASEVEDPALGLDKIDEYLRRSKDLVEACRAWLRTAEGKLEQFD